MISDDYIFAMNSIRSTQITLQHFKNIFISNPELYSNQITKIFQACDSSGLKKSTKYLTKKLIDNYMLTYPKSDFSEWEFIMISLFRYATKFNQVTYISDGFTYAECVRLCDGRFSKDMFEDFEQKILHDIQFNNLIFSSPYDYLQIFESVFTLMPKLAAKVQVILDFCISIPEFIQNTAQQMFFGSLWMIKLCKQDIFELDQKIIKAQTKNWKNAMQLGQKLKVYYQAQIQAAMQQENTEM